MKEESLDEYVKRLRKEIQEIMKSKALTLEHRNFLSNLVLREIMGIERAKKYYEGKLKTSKGV